MTAHDPRKSPLENLFPAEGLDVFPEHMQRSVLDMRRATRRRKVARRIIAITFYACLASLLLIAAWFVAQVTDRDVPTTTTLALVNPPLTEAQAARLNVPDERRGLAAVRPAGQLLMRVQAVRRRTCEVDITFYVYDGDGQETRVVLPHMDAKGKPGVDPPFVRPVTIPADAKPGVGRLRVVRAYQCPGNFVHEHYPVIDVSPDYPFAILPQGDAR